MDTSWLHKPVIGHKTSNMHHPKSLRPSLQKVGWECKQLVGQRSVGYLPTFAWTCQERRVQHCLSLSYMSCNAPCKEKNTGRAKRMHVMWRSPFNYKLCILFVLFNSKLFVYKISHVCLGATSSGEFPSTN